MKSTMEIRRHADARAAVEINIELAPDEMASLEKKACCRHIDSPKAIPCQFYQTADPEIGTVKGIPDYNGNPLKSYILPSSRKVALNRPIVGRSLLRVTVPGTLTLGFANERDLETLQTWWKVTEKTLRDELKSRLFEIENAETKRIIPTETTESVKDESLNPFNPNEIKGVRKRSMDDF